MTKVRRPTLKRYPKRPKAGASLAAWEKFNDRCRQVEKDNSAKMSNFNKLQGKVSSDKKRKESIIKKTSGLHGIALGKGRTASGRSRGRR